MNSRCFSFTKRPLYVLAGLTATFVVSISAYAWAGAKAGAPVSVYAYSGFAAAEGTIGTVHNSGSDVEFIGCHAAANNTSVGMQCTAADAMGYTFECTSYNANLVSVVNGINADSHLRVEASAREGGTCTAITVWHYSTHYNK